jgi:drug/metabolite transporter (DMT)-like permease
VILTAAKTTPGLAVIAFSSLPFATMAVLTRTLAGVVPSSQVVAVRFFIGLIGVALMFTFTRSRPNLRRWRLLLVRGFFGGVAVLCYFFAIANLGVGPATMLNYISPVYAAVFAGVILKERPGAWLYVGLVLATLGAILVTAGTGAFEHPLTPGLGAIAGVAAGVFGGASMTGVHALRKDTDATTVFFAFCFVGFLIAAPISSSTWVPLEGGTLLRVIGIGILSFIAQMLFSFGMGFTTASRGSAMTQLVPVVTWVLSVSLLGDWPQPITLAGAVLCLAGVLIGLVPSATVLEKSQIALPP